MKIGLFFGSFNPIHIGHLVIANQFVEFTDIEKVWFIVSPRNPLKEENSLMDATMRLKMVQVATESNSNFMVSDLEFGLPQPSYTINTLDHLAKEHPEHEFVIIMGSDSYLDLPKWKDYEKIKSGYTIYIYKRKGFDVDDIGNDMVFDFPYLDISATYIRKCLEEKKSIRYLVPDDILPFLT